MGIVRGIKDAEVFAVFLQCAIILMLSLFSSFHHWPANSQTYMYNPISRKQARMQTVFATIVKEGCLHKDCALITMESWYRLLQKRLELL